MFFGDLSSWDFQRLIVVWLRSACSYAWTGSYCTRYYVALDNLTPFAWALYMCDQNVKTWILSSPTKPGAWRRMESEAARKAGEGLKWRNLPALENIHVLAKTESVYFSEGTYILSFSKERFQQQQQGNFTTNPSCQKVFLPISRFQKSNRSYKKIWRGTIIG